MLGCGVRPPQGLDNICLHISLSRIELSNCLPILFIYKIQAKINYVKYWPNMIKNCSKMPNFANQKSFHFLHGIFPLRAKSKRLPSPVNATIEFVMTEGGSNPPHYIQFLLSLKHKEHLFKVDICVTQTRPP